MLATLDHLFFQGILMKWQPGHAPFTATCPLALGPLFGASSGLSGLRSGVAKFVLPIGFGRKGIGVLGRLERNFKLDSVLIPNGGGPINQKAYR